jgi:hypothetical protein
MPVATDDETRSGAERYLAAIAFWLHLCRNDKGGHTYISPNFFPNSSAASGPLPVMMFPSITTG